MAQTFAALPVQGYQLIEIDDDIGRTPIEARMSEPKPVLGFVIRQHSDSVHFSVLPVTAFGVHYDGGGGGHALIRPDGKIDYCYFGECTFDSIDELKAYLLRIAAESFRA